MKTLSVAIVCICFVSLTASCSDQAPPGTDARADGPAGPDVGSDTLDASDSATTDVAVDTGPDVGSDASMPEHESAVNSCSNAAATSRWVFSFEAPAGSTTFTDGVSRTNTMRNGDVIHTSAQKLFGETSAFFDGSGDYLSFTTPPWNINTTVYTLQGWIHPTNLGAGVQGIVGNDSNSSGNADDFYLLLGQNGLLSLVIGYPANIAVTSITPIAQNKWTHWEVSGSGDGRHTIFINGVKQRIATVRSPSEQLNTVVFIGAHNPLVSGYARYFQGYMKGLRLDLGVERHIVDFTPPASLCDYQYTASGQ